jgi:exopolysaccharide biosynthesis polyprenyl glycosylphosphotransferase
MRAQSLWIVALDLAALVLSCTLAVMLRFGPGEMAEYVYGHVDGWVMFFGSIIVANYLAGTYRIQYTVSRFNLLVTWVFAVTFAMFILSITSYAWFRILLGRGVLLLALGMYSALSLLFRLVAYRTILVSELLTQRVAIVGDGELAGRLRLMLENAYVIPSHRVVAWIVCSGHASADGDKHAAATIGPASDQPESIICRPATHDGLPVIHCAADELRQIVTGLGVNLVALGERDMDQVSAVYAELRRLRFAGIEVLPALAVAEIYNGKTPLELLNKAEIAQVGMESSWPIVWRTKRIVDIMVALAAGLACLPVGLVVALLIKLTAPRAPVFYSQERLGQFGAPFRIHKFRTMRVDAENATGAVWAAPDDLRITPVGRILRRFRLDEIPQFLNILKGEMSLVGPRPERPEIVRRLAAQIPFYDERENAMPGLTGWAQIQYPYGNTIEDARRKLEYDLYYIKNLSLSLDLQIILRTLRVVSFGKAS